MSPSTALSRNASRTVTDRSGVTAPRSAPKPSHGHTGANQKDPGMRRDREPFTRDERLLLAIGGLLAVCSASLLYGAIRTALG